MKKLTYLPLIVLGLACLASCGEPKGEAPPPAPQPDVVTGDDGHTAETRNIIRRREAQNTPGAIQHLYIISPYSGDVILYSTVDGKVTSSGKRLKRKNVHVRYGNSTNGYTYVNEERPSFDNAFGTSNPYLYWFDVRGVQHEHYVTGG